MATEKLIPLSEVKKKLTAVRQYFSGYPSTEQDKLARSVAKMCIKEIDKLKPVDAVPVVHGHWVDGRNCSECGSSIPTDNRYDFICEKDNRFCFYCGAKMDGERRTDNA